ncbi:Rad9 [Carabus blaptoides fortunei]
MNCVIPGSNVKFLGKTFHTLAKIGDEIYFEAQENQVVLSSVNAATTEFGLFKLLRQFFTKYHLAEDLSKTDSQDVTPIGVKIRAKPLCIAFKYISLLDRNLDTCTISLDSNPTKLKLNFEYKNKIRRLVNIWLMDSDESLEVGSLNSPNCHKIISWSTTFSHALANFRRTDSEITLIASSSKLLLRNYMDSDDVKMNAVRSQVSLSSNEFETYEILEDATVTFPSRAFRAAVQFADNFNRQITITFKDPGRPVEVQFSNSSTFKAKFIMATMHQSLSLNSTPTSASPVSVARSVSPESTESIDLLTGYKTHKKNSIEKKTAELVINDEFVGLRENKDDSEVIPATPDGSKRMRFLFQRCLEPTIKSHLPMDEEVYAENSDPECEAILYSD